MARNLRPSTIVPMGLIVQDVRTEGGVTVITAQSAVAEAACPACGAAARRVHSRYVRTLADLPLCGRAVRLRLMVRRLRCEVSACPRRIFTERLEPAGPWARRTARLDAVAYQLGLALGGRPGAGFAGRLMMPVSNDTLLRLVRRRGSPAFARRGRWESTTGLGSATTATVR